MRIPPGHKVIKLGDSHLLINMVSTADSNMRRPAQIPEVGLWVCFFWISGPLEPGMNSSKAGNSFPIPVGYDNPH